MTQKELDEKVIAAYSSAECEHPILDGIVNEEIFRSGIPKILWLMKEPYGEQGWSMREALDEGSQGMFKYKTFKNISYISYGIINHTSYEEAKATTANYEILKSIAFINISKCPTKEKTSRNRHKHFQKTFEQCKSEILEQIEYINPDIVIGGGVAYLLIFHHKLDWSGVDNHLPVMNRTRLEHNGRLIIDALHPASFKISQKAYCTEIIECAERWMNAKNIIK